MGGGDISPSIERREFFAGEMGKRSEKGGEKGGMLGGSPIENADLLYEYFPLSLDDWYVYFSFPNPIFHLILVLSWWKGGL
jgi:hypothetical protein